MKTYGGKSCGFAVAVFRCNNEDCTFKYTRVLPDIMTPHKHYSTEVIENVVDEVCTPETIQTEDYPCELTMQRWKDWIAGNRNHADGVLRSIGSRLLEFGEELLNSKTSLMDQLRKDGEGWLGILNRISWNFGMPFHNARQLCELSTALFSVSGGSGLCFQCKEENRDEIQRSSGLAGKHGFEPVPNHPSSSGSIP